MGKTQKWVGAEPGTQSPFQKKNLELAVKNCTKTDIKVSRPVQFCFIFINFVRNCLRK